jgi:hypothetical protein
MPREEYLKHFAHDLHGNYIGTGEQRRWSRKELDIYFGEYQHTPPPRWVLCKEDSKVFKTEGTT